MGRIAASCFGGGTGAPIFTAIFLVVAIGAGGTGKARGAHPAPVAPWGAPLGDESAVSAGFKEREIRAIETAVLGSQHAAEHAQLRAAQRSETTPGETGADETAGVDSAARAVGPADQVGRWTQAPFALPVVAIHAALLPTGKVLFFSGSPMLWDPAQGYDPGAFTYVPHPAIDSDGDGSPDGTIYCAGQVLLPNGAVLVIGGAVNYDEYPGVYEGPAGLRTIFTFDPWSETWTRQSDMEVGRWYPSAVLLPDGRAVLLSGITDEPPGGVGTDILEVFTPADDPSGLGTVEHVPSGDIRTRLYPHLFTLPDGDVLLAGPGQGDSGVLDTGAFSWQGLPQASRERIYGTAVLRPAGPAGSWRATQIGGYDRGQPDPQTGAYHATASTETRDAGEPQPTWESDAELNVARASHNTVLLPDGSMVTIGGGVGWTKEERNYATTEELKQVELYDPETDRWRLGPAQEENRAYHSTALLLPDGRVWSAGDGINGASIDTAEIYSPPYLFEGERPTIRRAPSAIGWDQQFRIVTMSSGIDRAVLMAPGATTHAADMNQRLVELDVVEHDGRGVEVVSPPSPAVAPPGYYMLFLVNEQGVPSVAEWVRLGEVAPEPQTAASPPLETTITNGPPSKTKRRGATFEFTSQEAEAFECRLDDGPFSPCSAPTTYTVGRGRHTFQVAAVDAAGVSDPTPATQTWKVKKKRRRTKS